jgi:putative transposase
LDPLALDPTYNKPVGRFKQSGTDKGPLDPLALDPTYNKPCRSVHHWGLIQPTINPVGRFKQSGTDKGPLDPLALDPTYNKPVGRFKQSGTDKSLTKKHKSKEGFYMQYRRSRVPGGTYFFTVVTQQRKPVLLQPVVHQRLRSAVATIKSRHPFKIRGWCLLPDHMHFIWTLPPADHNFAMRWRLIKHYVSAGTAIPAGLWQKRYWEHQINSETDFEKHLDYLHYNPVKHGLVERVLDWPHSSFHHYAQEGIYPLNWGCADHADGEFGE